MSNEAARRKGYHHGDLKRALLSEAARILEHEGLEALTLRAIARAADVTHTAPKHHFGDVAGLLSELAADGFRTLMTAVAEASEVAPNNGRARAKAMATAYLAFAQDHPGMFALMFRSERLDLERPALREAMDALNAVLRLIGGERAASPLAATARTMAVWSLVHGYALLAHEQRVAPMLGQVPGKPTPRGFFEMVLEAAM